MVEHTVRTQPYGAKFNTVYSQPRCYSKPGGTRQTPTRATSGVWPGWAQCAARSRPNASREEGVRLAQKIQVGPRMRCIPVGVQLLKPEVGPTSTSCGWYQNGPETRHQDWKAMVGPRPAEGRGRAGDRAAGRATGRVRTRVSRSAHTGPTTCSATWGSAASPSAASSFQKRRYRSNTFANLA